jgi:hypothetical protein
VPSISPSLTYAAGVVAVVELSDGRLLRVDSFTVSSGMPGFARAPPESIRGRWTTGSERDRHSRTATYQNSSMSPTWTIAKRSLRKSMGYTHEMGQNLAAGLPLAAAGRTEAALVRFGAASEETLGRESRLRVRPARSGVGRAPGDKACATLQPTPVSRSSVEGPSIDQANERSAPGAPPPVGVEGAIDRSPLAAFRCAVAAAPSREARSQRARSRR